MKKRGMADQTAMAGNEGRGSRPASPYTVLIVEDESSLRTTLSDYLRDQRFKVEVACDGLEARRKIQSRSFNLALLDIRLPKVDGITLFQEIRRDSPETRVILMTAFGATAQAVQAIKDGAYDYLTKPFDREELLVRIKRLQEEGRLRAELEEARLRLNAMDDPPTLLGGSPRMGRLLQQVEIVAASESNVLISGETGTGKELLAREIHRRSPRKERALVAVNCAAFPETLLEAELFGHEKGAFTGASKRRDGRFKAADGGTLLLDDVSELPPSAQAKLLRVIQEGTFEPLGTNETLRVDVRIVSTTNVDLRDRCKEGRFREDLYFRLNVVGLEIPPLRDRRDDMPLLAATFLQRVALKRGLSIKGISPRAWAILLAYPWPGNVRELEHAIEHAAILAQSGDIDVVHLPSTLGGQSDRAVDRLTDRLPLSEAMKNFEREYLSGALHATGGRKQEAARLLGISRKTLWEKAKELGLTEGVDSEEEEQDETSRPGG